MRKLLLTALFLSFGLSVWAQTTIKGSVFEGEEAIIGANVVIEGTTVGATTDLDGTFAVKTDEKSGDVVLVISFVGYETLKQEVTLNGGEVNLGEIQLTSSAMGLSEVEVIADVAVDRKTPVAATTIDGEYIEARVGNQEFPEILRSTPSVYVTKQGGGFGDSRINVRGFDQRNTAVMINGIPINDMENGKVYWSNWAGLSDVTSKMQVQRGLGASKLAVASVGGSINIITNAAKLKKGGTASVSVGNDGYQKYGLMLSSGLSKSGFAATVQLTHTRGNGYIDGTKFRAFSYFLSLSKKMGNNHTLAFTYLGAPQWHHQRTVGSYDGVTLRTYVNPDTAKIPFTNMGIRFNHVYGTLDGKEFSWRRNFYHKPKAFLNHYWTISEKMELNTSAYLSLGRGGGTGPRGVVKNGSGVLYDPHFSFRDKNGHVRFDDIVRYNKGEYTEKAWGDRKKAEASGSFSGKYVTSKGGDGFIRRASMNSHNWFGVISTLNMRASDKITVVVGFDGRSYKGLHYRRIENLLGNDAYKSSANKNDRNNYITTSTPADFGSFSDKGYKDAGSAGANVLNYYNIGFVRWLGLFSQVEYSTDQLTAFVSVSGSDQAFKRFDGFRYKENDPERETHWLSFWGGTIKTGANYNINDNHSVFANLGYFSRQPTFDNVFINFKNDINRKAKNQSVYAAELGYAFRSMVFDANLNLYNTVWGNRQFDQNAKNKDGQTINYQFENVSEVHRGVEVELTARPMSALRLTAMFSVGDWFYNNNFTARGTNIDTQEPEGELTIYGENLKVGDAAQTTLNLGASYEIIKGLRVNAGYFFADNLYAQYDINDKTFTEKGGQVVKLPAYGLMDAGIGYSLKFGQKMKLSLRLNVNNVLDTQYIAELDTNIKDNPNTENINEFYKNRGFYGFGRTWNAGLKLHF